MSTSKAGPESQSLMMNIVSKDSEECYVVSIADGHTTYTKTDDVDIQEPEVKQNNMESAVNEECRVAEGSIIATSITGGVESVKTQTPLGCEDHIGYIGDSNSLLTSKIVEELQQKLNNGKTSFRVVQVAELPGSPGSSHKQISIIPHDVETKSEIEKLSSEADDNSGFSTSNCFWTRPSTLLLINLHTEHASLFSDPHYKKKTVWEMLARKMRDKGHPYTWNQVESKWKAMTKKFRDAIDHNEKHGHVMMHVCSYFDELAEVYRYKPAVVERTLSSRLSDNGVKSVMGGKFRSSAKRSAEEVDADWDEDGIAEMPKKKKYGSSGTAASGYAGYSNDQSPEKSSELFRFLRNLHNDKKRQDMANMAKIEMMHKEKMTLFNSFLDIFRDLAKK